jgi:hypothetical protein
MSISDSGCNRIVFWLSGESLRRVIHWQQDTDLEVIRYQIETRGHALIIRDGELPFFGDLSEMPKPGEVTPWYGEVCAAYVFAFRPGENGCRLKVENMCAGMPLIYVGQIPPLELDIPEPIRIEADTPEPPLHGNDWGWWFQPRVGSVPREIPFVIQSDFYARLLQWGWDRARADSYEYRFWTSSVGTAILIRDTITGEEEDLTKDVCW